MFFSSAERPLPLRSGFIIQYSSERGPRTPLPAALNPNLGAVAPLGLQCKEEERETLKVFVFDLCCVVETAKGSR